MADLNALIAQGAQFQAPVNPFTQYAQMQQLDQGEMANQLARLGIQEKQRSVLESNALRNRVSQQGWDVMNPEHQAQLMQEAPSLAPGYIEKALTTRKTLGEINSSEFKLQNDKYSHGLLSMTAADTPDKALAAVDDGVAKGFFSAADGAKTKAEIVQAAQAGTYQDYRGKMVLKLMSAKDQLAATTPKPTEVKRTDGSIVFLDLNPTSRTYGQEIKGMTQPAGMTPYQTGDLKVKQGQLGVAQSNLKLRALAADPFNLAGAQDMFPLGAGGGAPAPAAAGAAPIAVPKAVPVAAPTLGGGKVSLNDAIKQGLKGNDLLAAMPAPLAAQVAAITDHRAAPPVRNTARGDQLIQLVQMVDPTYDSTSYGTKAGVEKAFASGRAGDTVRSFGVIQNHLDTLAQAGAALQNGDTQLLNKAGNAIASWTGEPAPAGFDAVKRIVAGEIVKAVTGAAGALGDRNAVDAVINAASSPAQLNDVIQKYKALIEGQVGGFRQQYKAGGGAKDFDKVFLGRTGTPAATAPAAGVDTSNKWLK